MAQRDISNARFRYIKWSRDLILGKETVEDDLKFLSWLDTEAKKIYVEYLGNILFIKCLTVTYCDLKSHNAVEYIEF